MMSNRRGFSLVELLIVIGVIAVLAGVLFSSFGGATESARNAQCLANMRALALAANARATASDFYPLAGSCEDVTVEVSGAGSTRYYSSRPGWISWLCQGNYESSDGNGKVRNHQSNGIFPFYGTGKKEDARFAITNGAIWVSCGKNLSIYTCPEHVLYCKKNKLPSPHFSYVMNARFCWDHTEGSGSIPMGANGVVGYGSLTRADKTLLFAELPAGSVDTEETSEDGGKGKGLAADCVLQYLDITSSDGKKGPYSSPSGKAESIGFVHKAGKGKRCAHVAFADGHTERLTWANGGVDSKTLTAYLCRGWDVSFSSKDGWNLAEAADKAE